MLMKLPIIWATGYTHVIVDVKGGWAQFCTSLSTGSVGKHIGATHHSIAIAHR